ncbi:hypothetical protein ACHAQH_001253 [Verticillium albo-atrum]
MFSKNESRPFLSDDPSADEANVRFHQPNQGRARIISHSIVCFVTSLFWVLIILLTLPDSDAHYTSIDDAAPKEQGHVHRHNITSNARLVTCGNSTQEAKEAGCQYDILLNNWVPEQCLDQEFIDEYRDDQSWAAFSDKEMTKQISVDDMAEVDFYYTSRRDHVNHCAMMWKKQFYVLFDEAKAFDTIVASPGHTDHCAQFLMDAPEDDWKGPTRTEMGFAGCWIRE